MHHKTNLISGTKMEPRLLCSIYLGNEQKMFTIDFDSVKFLFSTGIYPMNKVSFPIVKLKSCQLRNLLINDWLIFKKIIIGSNKL